MLGPDHGCLLSNTMRMRTSQTRGTARHQPPVLAVLEEWSRALEGGSGPHWVHALYVRSVTLYNTHTHTHRSKTRDECVGSAACPSAMSICGPRQVSSAMSPTHLLDVSGMCLPQPLCLPKHIVFLGYMCEGGGLRRQREPRRQEATQGVMAIDDLKADTVSCSCNFYIVMVL